MIKSKEEYYSILERLRDLNFNQKLSKNLQAKLEAFEEMEELVNLTLTDVVVPKGMFYCKNKNSTFDKLCNDQCKVCKHVEYMSQ